MSTWKNSISQSVGTERLGNIADYISFETPSHASCLDDFYLETRKIMALATPDSLINSDWLGSLYAISIVSCTENYFRNIFCHILKICSDSQKYAAKNQINLGSVIWHPNEVVERGAFEHISLASAENIIQTTKKYIGVEINKTSDVHAILLEFDRVCELRHGIIHSERVLAGKNAIILKVPTSAEITKVIIRYAQLQEISAICATLVVSFNQFLFELMCKRWATSWRSALYWNNQHEWNSFKNIWSIFHSKIDLDNGTIPEPLSCMKCCNQVRKEYNL